MGACFSCSSCCGNDLQHATDDNHDSYNNIASNGELKHHGKSFAKATEQQKQQEEDEDEEELFYDALEEFPEDEEEENNTAGQTVTQGPSPGVLIRSLAPHSWPDAYDSLPQLYCTS